MDRFPLGINNVDDQASTHFQLPTSAADSPPALTRAVNVDLDRNGWLRRRRGRTIWKDLTNGHSLTSINRRLLLVDAGVLYEVLDDGTMVSLASGIGNSYLSYVAVGDQIFYISEETAGIVGGLWGLDLPAPPFLTSIAGNLSPGEYMVAITVEANGLESGARLPTKITLATQGGIQASLSNIDPQAEYVNVYCSEPDGRDLYWVDRLPIAATVNITSVQRSTDPLRTFNYYPPPKGQFIAVHRGYMLIASGSVLYWSQPLDYHHFRIQSDLQLLPSRIVMLITLDTGFFIATESSTYWITGDIPDLWTITTVDSGRVIEGSAIRLPAHKFPTLNDKQVIRGEVAVWMSNDGFVVGLPDGTTKHITDSRLAIDTYNSGRLLFREQDNLRQIIASLHDKQEDNALGISDRATCHVIRATQENIGEL